MSSYNLLYMNFKEANWGHLFGRWKFVKFIHLSQEQSNAQAWVEDAGGKAESVRRRSPACLAIGELKDFIERSGGYAARGF